VSRSASFAAALAAFLAACSPEAGPPAEGNGEAALAAPSGPANAIQNAPAGGDGERPGNQVAAKAPSPAAGERRCGWLHNPTPGNWWLDDRDGQWVLASQGSEPAPGMDDMPDMSTVGWVETNGHYGHGCACMTIAHDPATKRVTRIADAQPKPLKQCRADKSLPRPD
jgi:hypothetical protein